MRFSVIVPVYNAKRYLRKCVESVCAQSYSDWELILVDDGSTDGSGKLCDSFAEYDSRIHVVHQKNSGVVIARKAGIGQAKGEYVFYVDADDWIEPDCLADADARIRETGADLVTYGFRYVSQSESGKCKLEPVPEGMYLRADIIEKIYPRILLGPDMQNMFYTITGKAGRREIFMEGQKEVPDYLAVGEDAACSVRIYLAASKVCVSHKSVYCYRLQDESVTHCFRMDLYRQLADTVRYLEKQCVPEISDFAAQLDRYVMLVMFATMLLAMEKGNGVKISEIRNAMAQPVFRAHMIRAKFETLTPKTRITYFLYKRGWIRTAWMFLRLCDWIRRGLKSERIHQKTEKKNSV